MRSLYIHLLVGIIFHVPSILATKSKLALASVYLTETPDCVMIPKMNGHNCNPQTCFADGGRCLLDEHRCAQAKVVEHIPGLSYRRISFFDSGPESCTECRCSKARRVKKLMRASSAPRLRAAEAQARGEVQVDECIIQSSRRGPGPVCKAASCFDGGGRCKVTSDSGYCFPHLTSMAGKLYKVRWGPDNAPQCYQCHCTKKNAR